MRSKILVLSMLTSIWALAPANAWARGFAGGFHAGGFGGGGFAAGGFHGGDVGGFHASSFHSGGFSNGYGSVQHFGASHYGPATGFTHVGGTNVQGFGESASTFHGGNANYGHTYNYGSISHYDTAGAYGHTYTYDGYGAGVYHGPAGGTAAAYHGPYSSGAAVRGPEGYSAAAVKGPYGGTAAAYHGPYTSGYVRTLPSGYSTTVWHGTTYYHYGYTFYQPYYYGGAVYYQTVPIPVGFFFDALPPAASPVVVSNTTYYVADGVYYQSTTQEGKTGYVVVEAPAGAPQQTPPATKGPDPLIALQKMSTYLGQQDHFMIQANETYDEVATAGEKYQISSVRTIRVARPDKAAADITTGQGAQRRVVFDGRKVTLIDETANTYGIIPLAGTLDVALDTVAREYGIAMPLGDLLYSNVYARLSPKIQSGQYLGKTKVNGKDCDHFLYVQPGLTWQVWIDTGDKPVPRKLVIAYDTRPGRPQYTITVTKWDTKPQSPEQFRADIPPNAVKANVMSLVGEIASGQ